MEVNDDLVNFIRAKQREIKVFSQKNLINIDKKHFIFSKIKNRIDTFLETDGEYYHRLIMMSGLRGVGKTTIIYQIYEYLIKEKGIDENNILYLDLNELKKVMMLILKRYLIYF